MDMAKEELALALSSDKDSNKLFLINVSMVLIAYTSDHIHCNISLFSQASILLHSSFIDKH